MSLRPGHMLRCNRWGNGHCWQKIKAKKMKQKKAKILPSCYDPAASTWPISIFIITLNCFCRRLTGTGPISRWRCWRKRTWQSCNKFGSGFWSWPWANKPVGLAHFAIQWSSTTSTLTPFFLEGTKLLYKIWPTKWFLYGDLHIIFSIIEQTYV